MIVQVSETCSSPSAPGMVTLCSAARTGSRSAFFPDGAFSQVIRDPSGSQPPGSAGRPVAAADGMLVNLADTPANRAFFGTTGTADGSSPFPQLRVVAVTARAGRARLGAILGQAGTGEQTLLKRLVKRRPELFASRVICFDRNFPGYDLVIAILRAGMSSPA